MKKFVITWLLIAYFYPPSVPIVPFVASFSIGPNVLPLSILILITGTLDVKLLSHNDTSTLLRSAAMSAFTESSSFVLLRLILSPNVLLPSVEALTLLHRF